MTKSFSKWMALFSISTMLCWANNSIAHGLKLTTANVIIRNQSHFTLYLQYDPLRLMAQINPHKKFLAALSSMPEKQLEQEYQQIKALLKKDLSIYFNQQPIHSPYFRFPPLKKLRYLINDLFIAAVMDSGDKVTEDHAIEDRGHFQTVEIDGFLPKNLIKNVTDIYLEINFPRELGEVMVTISNPVLQTIKPNKDGSHYRQLIK